jgi:rubrerythrin
MDVYDYAMQMERDGESFYREAALQTEREGFRNILTRLADAEAAHYKVFKSWKDKRNVGPAKSTLLKGVQNIFEQMRSVKDLPVMKGNELHLYRQALEIEQKSIDFYQQKSTEAATVAEAEALSAIAREEEKHYIIVEKIIDFVSRPEKWIENAEFFHLEEY